MALGKEELLAAIAAAGSAGRQAYDQANQQIAAQQQAAVQQAMMGAANAPEEARAQLSGIISQPYQQRTAQITQNRSIMDDWYNRQSTMQNTYLDQALRLAELRAAELAAGGSGGGGGGGGGGGSGDGEFDWYKNLKDTFGTAEIGFDAVGKEAEALGLTSYNKSGGLSPFAAQQKYAMDEYGIPQGVAATKYVQSKPDAEFQSAAVNNLAEAKRQGISYQKYMQGARSKAQSMPGPQRYIVAGVKKQARQTLKKGKGKKK